MRTGISEDTKKMTDSVRIDGRILSTGVIDNPPLLYIYINGILTSAKEEGVWIEGAKSIKVGKGEFVCSFGQISSKFGISSQMARKCFERLKQLGFITECEIKRGGIAVAKLADIEQLKV